MLLAGHTYPSVLGVASQSLLQTPFSGTIVYSTPTAQITPVVYIAERALQFLGEITLSCMMNSLNKSSSMFDPFGHDDLWLRASTPIDNSQNSTIYSNFHSQGSSQTFQRCCTLGAPLQLRSHLPDKLHMVKFKPGSPSQKANILTIYFYMQVLQT